MVSRIEVSCGVEYLVFKPNDVIGLMMLPVIRSGSRDGTNCWSWNGDLESPTIRPSVRTVYMGEDGEMTEIHYWLNGGVCECLGDCKDGNSGKSIELMEID